MSLDSLMPNEMLDSSFAQRSEPVVRMAEGGIADLPMDQEPRPAALGPDSQMVFDNLRQNLSPKEISDELLSSAAQVDPQAVSEFVSALQELDVPPEILDLLDRLVDEVLANPDNYEEIKNKYRAQGVTEDILPEKFDPQLFGALNLAIDQLRGKPAAPVEPQQFAKGGIANLTPVAKAIAAQGRNGDTMLAHITPAEARMLKKRGGSGTINPATGLPEFANIFSRIGNAIKKFAGSTVGKLVIGTALFMVAGPAAAQFLTLSSPMAVAGVSGFVAGAGTTLLAGGNLRDALKAGAIGGITAGAMQGLTGMGPSTPGAPSGAEAVPSTPGAPSAPAAPTAPAAPAAPVTPAAVSSGPPTLPTLPGSQALSSVMPPSTGIPAGAFTETGFTGMMPGSAPVAPPVSTAAAPAAVPAVAPAGTSSVAAPTSFFDKTTDFLKQTFSPSAIEAQGVPAAEKAGREAITSLTSRLPDATPAMKEAAYQAAYKQALPGVVAKYGPMAAAGLGIMGLSGGFRQQEVKSPYTGLFTGGPGSARDLLMRNPSQYYIQNLPGVSYYSGSVVPPGYAHGGEVQHFADGGETLPTAEMIGQQAATQTPAAGVTAALPAATTAPLTQVGIAAAPTTQVATPGVGGYNMYSPAAQNMYYGVINQGLLSGTQYNPQTRRNETVTISRPTVGTPYNTAAPYSALGGEPPVATPAVMPTPQRMPIQFPMGERLAEIEGSYRSLLGREPDVAGLMAFGSPQFNLSMQDIRNAMLASPERQQYLARLQGQQPTAPETVVKPITVPMVQPRAPADPISGLPRIAAQNVAAVDTSKPIIISSTAPAGYDYSAANVTSDRERQINDLYRSILNRDAEQSGLNYWRDSGLSLSEIEAQIRKIAGDIGVPLTLPQNVPVADVAKPVIISSTAPVGYSYAAAPITNEREQQINDLYRNILNRDAEKDGLNYWRDSGLSIPEIEKQIRKIAGDIGVTVAAPAVSSGSRSTLPPNVGGVGGKTTTDTTNVQLRNMGGIASLGTGGYPRRTGQISGPGTEKSDSIPAMLSDGEFVMTAKAVRGAGKGSRREGAKKMYALMHQLERNASRS